jgi:hypothetical protein
MAEILSGARKYRIGLTLAHHELHQLERDKEVASAVMTHPFTRIVFRVGDDDAKRLSEGFSHYEATDLRNLEVGQAICRVERSDFDFNLSVRLPKDPAESEAAERARAVISASRQKYATPCAEVEAALHKEIETDEPKSNRAADPKTPPPKPEGHKQPPRAPLCEKVETPPPRPPKARSEEESVGDETAHTRIKDWIADRARSLGYTVEPEERIRDTAKRIDVVLRRGVRVIACEVTSKNEPADDIRNIEKCFKAGFVQVVIVSNKPATLLKVQELAKARLPAEGLARVTFRLPDEFIKELADWAAQDPVGAAAELTKPHKSDVMLGSRGRTEAELREYQDAMLKELAKAMKRKRNPGD